MLDSRRWFLKGFAGVSGSLLLWQEQPPTPIRSRHNPMPDAPTPGDMGPAGAHPDPNAAQRARLKYQEKQLRETMEKLFERVSELKRELDATHTTDVFSLDIVRRTQEIEKLAKQLKNEAKT